jgi:mono/diheme cytochrome c family protein
MKSRRVRLAAVAAAAFALTGCAGRERPQAEMAREGRQLFEGTCAACHGLDIEGTDSGPSLLDPIYAPDHHPDEAFYRAAREGVAAHHWNFGPMPRQMGVTEEDVEAIIAYVRQEQREAGVTSDRSRRTPQPEP